MYGGMYYANIINCDVNNGKGVRVSLFVSGCSHGCDGCFNSIAMNPRYGEPFTEEAMSQILDYLRHPSIRGISLLGGDPLYFRNLTGVNAVVDRIREELPEKDIWLWTGYRLEELNEEQLTIVKKVDMVIDGRYEKDNKTLKPFRGSDNQVQYSVINQIPVKVL